MKATKKEIEFLKQSNWIEQEYSDIALEDAISAWEYTKGLKTITFDDIMKIHFLMQQRLRPDISGSLRGCDVYIGGKRKMFISSALLKDDITNFTNKIMGHIVILSGIDREESNLREGTSKKDHVIFEGIHPFEDGNGRVGRIIYNWERLQMGLKIHVINADWPDQNGDQANYYKWFKEK